MWSKRTSNAHIVIHHAQTLTLRDKPSVTEAHLHALLTAANSQITESSMLWRSTKVGQRHALVYAVLDQRL